jgi:hypothetical protein
MAEGEVGYVQVQFLAQLQSGESSDDPDDLFSCAKNRKKKRHINKRLRQKRTPNLRLKILVAFFV